LSYGPAAGVIGEAARPVHRFALQAEPHEGAGLSRDVRAERRRGLKPCRLVQRAGRGGIGIRASFQKHLPRPHIAGALQHLREQALGDPTPARGLIREHGLQLDRDRANGFQPGNGQHLPLLDRGKQARVRLGHRGTVERVAILNVVMQARRCDMRRDQTRHIGRVGRHLFHGERHVSGSTPLCGRWRNFRHSPAGGYWACGPWV